MKLGIQILAFREKNRIIPCIEQYYDIADKIVVAVSKKPWHSILKADNTLELAKQTSADVYGGSWETEAKQRNFTLEKMEDMDFILVAPPDRFYTEEDLRLIRLFVDHEAEGGVYSIRSLNYWKNFDTVIWPTYDLPHFLFSRMLPSQHYAYFKYANLLHEQEPHYGHVPGVTSHHVSWIKTDMEMKEKMRSYTHARETRKGWYNKYWLNWNEKKTNFGTTVPEDFRYTVKYSLPKEIVRKFPKEWVKEINDNNS